MVITSKTPRQRPSLPMTPASSSTSRIAVTEGSSSGSTPPPGTIQLSGRRDDVTNSTYAPKQHAIYSPPGASTSLTAKEIIMRSTNLRLGVRPHANTSRAASEPLVVVDPNRIRLLLHHFSDT